MARRYTGIPENSNPASYVSEDHNADGELRWVIGRYVLVYVKGDAGRNGRSDTQSGWGVAYTPSMGKCGRLPQESYGYDKSTFRRAELHAALVAAKHTWTSEGYSRVVIATDSEYIFKGITSWILKWQRNGWLTSREAPVKHQDLWEQLWQAIETNDAKVEFYFISPDQNKAAPLAQRGMGEYKQPIVG